MNKDLVNIAEECLQAARLVEAKDSPVEADTVKLLRLLRRFTARVQEIHNLASGWPPAKHG